MAICNATLHGIFLTETKKEIEMSDKKKQSNEAEMLAIVAKAAVGMHTEKMVVSDAQKYEKVLMNMFTHGYEFAKELVRSGVVKL